MTAPKAYTSLAVVAMESPERISGDWNLAVPMVLPEVVSPVRWPTARMILEIPKSQSAASLLSCTMMFCGFMSPCTMGVLKEWRCASPQAAPWSWARGGERGVSRRAQEGRRDQLTSLSFSVRERFGLAST